MRKKLFSLNSIILFAWVFAMVNIPLQASAAMSTHELRLQALEEKMEAQAKAFSWLKKFKPNGDFRLRHESLFRQGENASSSQRFDRSRQRLRFRIGGEYFFTKNIKAGFRLATGPEDSGSGDSSPTSTNQTFDNTFSTKNINLDKAYADWKIPFDKSSVQLRGGKFGVPFMKSQQIWDSDVTVEGAAEKLTHKIGNTKLELILGQFVVEEFGNSATDGGSDDVHLFAYQGVVSQNLGDFGKAKVGAAIYDFQNVQGNNLVFGPGANTVDADGDLASNFNIVNVLAEFQTDMVMGVPVKVFGGYVQNFADEADDLENDGWEAGVKIGKSVKKLGDWQVKYFFRNTGKDAVVDALNDSDFFEGGTNSEGSVVGLKVGLYDGILLSLTYMDTESIIGPSTKLQLLHADLVLALF
jgi:Putative porin